MYLLQPVDETETRDTPGNVSLLTSSIFSHSTEFHGNSFKHSLTSFRSNKPIFSFGKFSASRKQNRNKRNRVLYYNLASKLLPDPLSKISMSNRLPSIYLCIDLFFVKLFHVSSEQTCHRHLIARQIRVCGLLIPWPSHKLSVKLNNDGLSSIILARRNANMYYTYHTFSTVIVAILVSTLNQYFINNTCN